MRQGLFSKLRLALFATVFASSTGQAIADVCHIVGRGILGDPIELVLRWPLDIDRPPEFLERPAEPETAASLDDLFSDSSSASSQNGCEGGGIVGALNCEVVQPIKDRDADSSPTESLKSDTESKQLAGTGTGSDAAINGGEGQADYEKFAYATVSMRPVVYPGSPMAMFLAHENTEYRLDRSKADTKLLDQIRGDMAAVSTAFRQEKIELSDQGLTALVSGQSWASPGLSKLVDGLRTPKTDFSLESQIQFPDRCRDLLRTEAAAAEAAAAVGPLREKLKRLRDRQRILGRAKPEKIVEEIADLKQRRADLVAAGLPTKQIDNEIRAAENFLEEVERYDPWYGDRSILHGTSGKTKLANQIAALERQIGQASQPANMLSRRADRLRKELQGEVHAAEVAAIKGNPDLLKAETTSRVQKAREAFRDIRNIQKDRADAIAAYRDGMKNFDRRIAAAPDDASRDELIKARERYEGLYNQWTDQSQGLLASRHKDLSRTLNENQEDGIGPSSVDDIYVMSQKQGLDTVEYFDTLDPEQRFGRAAERARAEQETLGGTSTGGDSGWWQVAEDTASIAMQDAQRVHLSPSEIREKLTAIAEGKTTPAEAFKDQIEFAERYGHYAKGSAKGAVKGLFDIGDLAYKGSSYQMEVFENALEESLSDITGEPVKIDYFGNRQHRALDKFAEGAGKVVDNVLKRSKLRHSVQTDENGVVSLNDVWEDPGRIADFYFSNSGVSEFANSQAGRVITDVTNLAGQQVGTSINTVNKGGEAALRSLIGKTGETVTEIADLGVAGAGTAARITETATDLAKSLRRLEDGVVIAKADVPTAVRAPDLTQAVSNPSTLANPSLADVPEALQPTARLENPLEPVANPIDDFTARVPGDAPSSRLDLSNVPDALKPTERLPRNRVLQDPDEKTAELDLDIPPPAAAPRGDRPAERFDRARITEEPADTSRLAAREAGSSSPGDRTDVLEIEVPPPANRSGIADKLNANTNARATPEEIATKRPDNYAKARPPLPRLRRSADRAVSSDSSAPLAQPSVQPGNALDDQVAPGDIALARPENYARAKPPAPRLGRASEPRASLEGSTTAVPLSPSRNDALGTQPTIDEIVAARPENYARARPPQPRLRSSADRPAATELPDAIMIPKPRTARPTAESVTPKPALPDPVMIPKPAQPARVATTPTARPNQPLTARANPETPKPNTARDFDPNGETLEMERPRPADPFDADGDGNFGLNDELARQLLEPRTKRTRDEVILNSRHLADRLEIDGPLAARELSAAEVGVDAATPFQANLSSIADDLPILDASATGPGYTVAGNIGAKHGSVRKQAENSQIQIRTPNGQTKTYRIGEKLGDGATSSVYQSLDEFGFPDGNVIRLTDVSQDRVGLFRDMTGKELLRAVEANSPYFSTSGGSSKPDIVRIGYDDVAVSREAEVVPASAKFGMRNNAQTSGPREPNKLESLTMQMAIRDLNKQGLAWTDHKLQNFALVADTNSPTGYRMVIFDTGSIIPMKGLNAAGRASNARHVQAHFDRPTDGSKNHFMTLLDSNLTNRMDRTPFGRKLDELGGEHRLAVSSHGKNRGRDEYFRLSQMSDAELNHYIQSDTDLRALLEGQGKSTEDVLIR